MSKSQADRSTSGITRRSFLKTSAAVVGAAGIPENMAQMPVSPSPDQSESDSLDPLRSVPTTLIIDALSRSGFDRTKLAMSREVRPVVPVRGTSIGQAVITKYEPSRSSTSIDDIKEHVFRPVDNAPSGAMWVTAAGTEEILSMFGDMIVLACRELGLSGLVTDGGCRDIEGIEEVGLPVFAKGLCLYGPGNVIRPVASDVPVICGGIQISPGDIVAADINGVLAFPAAAVPELVAQIVELEEKEAKCFQIHIL